jgi:hypothetical protein
MSFILYMIGFIIFTVGLAFAANRLGVNNFWIGTGVAVLLGLGILTGVSRTRQKDPPQ